MRILLSFILLLFSISLSAQNGSITIDQFKNLYFGVNNKITVLVENCKCNEIEIEGSQLQIDRIKDSSNTVCKYNVKPTRSSGLCLITVFSTKDNVRKELFTNSFRATPVPLPEIILYDSRQGHFGNAKPLNLALLAKLKGFHIFTSFDVTEFTAFAKNELGELLWQKTYTGFKFSDKLKYHISKMNNNDTLLITNIRISGSGYRNKIITQNLNFTGKEINKTEAVSSD